MPIILRQGYGAICVKQRLSLKPFFLLRDHCTNTARPNFEFAVGASALAQARFSTQISAARYFVQKSP